jgi:hypothetical protein
VWSFDRNFETERRSGRNRGGTFRAKEKFFSDRHVSKKLTPDAATILSQLRARRKKSKTDLADLEAILKILES